jgi:hypothetical protein
MLLALLLPLLLEKMLHHDSCEEDAMIQNQTVRGMSLVAKVHRTELLKTVAVVF